MSHVNITLGSERVGTIEFMQPDPSFGAIRTASGFRVLIPTVVSLSAPEGGSPMVLENLEATFSADSREQAPLEIGTATYSLHLRTPVRESPVALAWDWSFAAFASYEKLRDGREPKFRLTVSGHIRHLLPGELGKEPCSVGKLFQEHGTVGYSQVAWTRMLRELKIQDTIVTEIPFPSGPPTGWEHVWDALTDARDSFEKGGATGWKSCVASVRHALEEWRKLEVEDPGPGWQRPKKEELEARTKSQRMDALRWHLIQCAHLAPHTKADNWTREDAALAMATLCALIAVRKP